MKEDFKIDFIGIGAFKSGSTWIAQCLYEHPEISFPRKNKNKELSIIDKETNFFASENKKLKRYFSYYKKGINWYIKLFPKNSTKVKGEFSVSYLSDPNAYKRIKKHFPNVKIIAVLRNPVDLTYSLYNFLKEGVHFPELKNMSFEEFLKDPTFRKESLHYHNLNKYYETFPSKNIKIIIFEDFKDNPEKGMQDLFEFLGVDASFRPNSLNKTINQSVTVRSRKLSSIAAKLISYLRKNNFHAIYEFISRNKYLYNIYRLINTRTSRYKKLTAKERMSYYSYFKDDIKQLEKLLQIKLDSWKIIINDN